MRAASLADKIRFAPTSIRHFSLPLTNCQQLCPWFPPSQRFIYLYLSSSLSCLSLSSLIAPLLYAIICWLNLVSQQLRMEGTHCKHRGKRDKDRKQKSHTPLVGYEKKTTSRTVKRPNMGQSKNKDNWWTEGWFLCCSGPCCWRNDPSRQKVGHVVTGA